MEEKVGPIIKNGKIVVALIEQNHVTATMLNLKTDDFTVVCHPFKGRHLQRNESLNASDETVRYLEEEIYKTIDKVGPETIHAYLEIIETCSHFKN